MATSVAWSPDGTRLVTGGLDGAVREWRRDGTAVRTIASGLPRVWCVRYSPDGGRVAAGDGEGNVHAWHGEGTPMVLRSGGQRVPDLAFSPDGRLLAAATIMNGVVVWDAAPGEVRHVLPGHGRHTRVVAFTPDGTRIATGGDDRVVRLWDSASGALARVIEGLPWGPFSLAPHPTEPLMFAVGPGSEVLVLDVESGQKVATLRVHERHTFSVAVMDGGARLATSGEDSWIGVVDLEHLKSYLTRNRVYWLDPARQGEGDGP